MNRSVWLSRGLVAGLVTSLALGGCAGPRTLAQDPRIELTDLATLPEPVGEFALVIGPQERLQIEVVGAAAFTGEYLTDADGHIGFPYLGLVETGGKSPAAASRIIADGLRGRYVIDPQVRVIPETLVEPSISIGGQVNKPGLYPARGRVTLLRLIGEAEGLAQFAKEDDVLVFRTVEEKNYIGVYDFEAVSRGNAPDPRLYPDDIVVVGDSAAKRRLDSVFKLAPVLTPVAILIDRLGQ